MKLFIKYCGGCNPSINRKELVHEITQQLRSFINLELTSERADVGLVVGGCPVCCVNLNDIKDRANELVIIGGHLVNSIQVPPDQQTNVVIQQVLKKGGKINC